MSYQTQLFEYMAAKDHVCKKNWAKELAKINPYLFG